MKIKTEGLVLTLLIFVVANQQRSFFFNLYRLVELRHQSA